MSTSTRSFVDRHNRMLEKLSNKMNQAIGRRADLHVEDSQGIDANSCRVMVAYAQHLGPVTSEQLEEFVIREFQGQLVPNMATAKSFSDVGRVMVVLTRANVTRPMEDTAQMRTVVANAVYVDTTLGDTWEVMTEADGSRHLQRVAADDINAIVAERRKRMNVTASTKPLTITAALANYGGTLNANVGDTVKVMYRGGIHADAVVAAVTDDSLTVKIPNIGTAIVSKPAVVEIQQVSAKAVAGMQKNLYEYFRQIYGDEYARLLTEETTTG